MSKGWTVTLAVALASMLAPSLSRGEEADAAQRHREAAGETDLPAIGIQRASDAIAVALRTGSSIFVAKKVIDKSRKIDLAEEGEDESTRKQKWTEILENLSPEDFGKYKM